MYNRPTATVTTARSARILEPMKKRGGRGRKGQLTATEMGKRRWAGTTKAERREAMMKLVEARRRKREQGKPPE